MAKNNSTPRTKTNTVAAKAEEKTMPATEKKVSLSKLCIILTIISFVLYANTLKNEYAIDDGLVITHNTLIDKGFKGVTELLTTPHLQGYSKVVNDTYRPLSLVAFAIEKELFGYNPVMGHFFNILWFGGCVVLLFLFLNKLLGQKKIAVAFIATLLFAIHPIHTEVVANIKSRDELICFFFAFASLNLFWDYANKGKTLQLLGGAFTLFLSFLSKETVISFVAVVPLVFFFYNNEDKRRSIYITASAAITTLVFLGIRMAILHGVATAGDISSIIFTDNQLSKVPAGASGIATAILAMGYYIKLLFIPYPLLCSYSYATIPFVTFGNIWVLLSLAAYLSLAGIGIYRLVKIKKDLWAFGILFFLATIALFSNILFLVGALVGERFVFFGSVGFCLVVALAVEKWLGGANVSGGLQMLRKPKVLLFLVPLVLLFGNMTIARNKEWENSYTIFKNDADNAVTNARLYCNVALVLTDNLNNEALRPDIRARMTEESITYFRRSLEIYPDDAHTHAGLGLLFYKKHMLDSAEAQENRALALDPRLPEAINNMAGIYFEKKQYEQALSLFRKILLINPDDKVDYKNIGMCHYHMQAYDSAIVNFRKAIPYFVNEPKLIYQPIAITYRSMGNVDSAVKYEQMIR